MYKYFGDIILALFSEVSCWSNGNQSSPIYSTFNSLYIYASFLKVIFKKIDSDDNFWMLEL